MTTLDDLEALVQLAMSEGARAAEVLGVRGEGVEIDLPALGSPKDKSKQVDEVTVRVWVDGGRVGRMKGRLSEGSELVGQALASTFESREDRHAGPMASIAGLASGLGTADRRYKHLTLDDRIEVVTDIERQVRTGGGGFRCSGVHYRDLSTWRGLVNSRGFQAEEKATSYRLESGVTGHGLELSAHMETRSFASIASLPMGTNLVRRGKAVLEDGKTLEPGPVRLVLPPLPMSRILSVMGPLFTPEKLTSEKCFLSPSGETAVFAEKFHLLDDGTRPGALRTRAFDDRGVPPVTLTLIREGRVDSRFLDPESARRFDTRPTGHCWGDGVAPSNLLMRSGTRSLNALLTELGGPSLMVDDVDPKGIDLATGAVDWVVSGKVLDANRVVGAMRNVRIRGNLKDLLAGIVDIGNDTDRIGHIDAAGVIADGLSLEA